MAKNILDLPQSVVADPTDLIYIVQNGLVDASMSIGDLQTALKDAGLMYDPAASFTINGSSATANTVTAATGGSNFVKTFSVNEATGLFTFNANAVGNVYEITASFLSTTGTSKDEEVGMQLRRQGSVDTVKLIDTVYIANKSLSISLGGSSVFIVNAANDTVSIEIYGSTAMGSVTPENTEIKLERIG